MSHEIILPELLTLRELAKMLMVSERTAWQWAHDGISPAGVRIGKGTTRYVTSEYRDWMATGCQPVNGGQHQ